MDVGSEKVAHHVTFVHGLILMAAVPAADIGEWPRSDRSYIIDAMFKICCGGCLAHLAQTAPMHPPRQFDLDIHLSECSFPRIG